MFQKIQIRRSRRPRILLTGDLYVKNNDAFNQNIVRRIEELGRGSHADVQHGIFSLQPGGRPLRKEQSFTELATYYVTKRSWKIGKNFTCSRCSPICRYQRALLGGLVQTAYREVSTWPYTGKPQSRFREPCAWHAPVR